MIPISISGIDDQVPIIFFNNLNIIREDIISDWCFLTIEDRHGKCQIQVHMNFWTKIKREILINKIIL